VATEISLDTEIASSSWPGRPQAESRPSNVFGGSSEDVDARDKPTHNNGEAGHSA
jgi:hypothetical protein